MSKEVLSDLSVKGTLSIPKTGGGEMNVQQEIEGKQATLSFDSTPTAGSTNPVKSGGVYDALTVLEKLITPLMPPVDCTELLTMYKGDATLTETPLINATGCTSLNEVFSDCTNLKTVKYIHTPNVTDMYGTFRACSSLTSIPEMDTSNVTDMRYMFRGCSSLTSIPEIDTSSVTNANNMTQMFAECSSLTSVTFVGGVVPPYEVNMFVNTPIASGNGNIFVPDNLVDAYKTASGWSNHASVIRGIRGWYDTLGFTEFTLHTTGTSAETNSVPYTTQELIDITPFYVKWAGALTDVETGEVPGDGNVDVQVQMKGEKLKLQPGNDYEIIIQSSQIPVVPEDESFDFRLSVFLTATGLQSEVLVDGYFVIRENDANGVVLGHYPLNCTLVSTCYLTSAMVGYYGKADDGIELTAMRRLREIYAEKHAETLKTYYSDSVIIVSEIERLGMQEHYYGRIKDVVDEIVTHVDNENWNAAEGLYLDLYYGLKDELM